MITQNPPALKVWRTTQRRPELRNGADFRHALHREGFKVSEQASDLLCQKAFIVATEGGEVDFVRLTNADLNRPDGCTFSETCRLALAVGLELCEPDDGPNLRLNYQDQPSLEWLIIAMKAIVGYADDDLFIFGVVHNHIGRWLTTYRGYPDNFFSGCSQFVFRLPRNM